MARTKATLGAGARLADYLTLGYLALNCPLQAVHAALADHGKQSQRRRGLPHEVLVYYVMCLSLYREAAYEEVLRIAIEGLRHIYGDQISDSTVSKGAISQARHRVGAEVFESLYRSQIQVCGPASMPGVWYRGFRVMGLDGSTMEVPDEVANAEHFGYPGVSRGAAAFPRFRFCALVECGTRVLIGAQMGPYRAGEKTLASEVMQASQPDMLVLSDRGFVGYAFWLQSQVNGAKLLFRARDNQVLPVLQRLEDGSYLSKLYETPKARRHDEGVQVRVIEYALEGSDESYRLVTNWLEAGQAPAHELAALYHRRWQIETAFAELKTQLNGQMTLRSKTPELVRQEFYALLITHAAIRRLMTQAAEGSHQACEDLSFIHAVRVIKRRLPQVVFSPSA